MPDMIVDTTPASAPLPNRSPEIDKLAAALAKAQGEIEGAIKDKNNPAFRSKYADLGAVWDAIREPFAKNGLAVTQFPRRVDNSVEVETILMHASGQWMSGRFSVPTAKQDAHGYGSATTYARRFALAAVCGVAPVDDDGNAAAGHQTRALEEARRDIVEQNGGETRSTYQIEKEKKADKSHAARAKTWTDNAIGTLNLDGHSDESLSKFWKENDDKIGWLESHAPDQHERLLLAYENAKDAIKARAA